jgi:AraC-like DNA-binding protein
LGFDVLQFGQAGVPVESRLTDRALPERLPAWGVLVLESHHSPQFTMDWRSHPFVKLVYVLKGRGTFYIGQEKAIFSTGDLIVVSPRTRNKIEDDPASAASLYVCCVATSLLKFDPPLLQHLQSGRIDVGVHFANRVASRLRRMVYTQEIDRTTRPVSMVGDALSLIQMITDSANTKTISSRSDSPSDRQVMSDYIRSLQNEFFEATTIDDAAELLHMPRRTFTKLFNQQTGQTWLQFVRALAINHAKQRLQQTQLPIPSVAFECGFNDLSTFYRQFKSQVGISPALFRQRSQNQS